MMKKLDDMTIKDAFMFAAAMTYEDVAKDVLAVILDQEIKEVHVVTEKSLQYHPDFKGIRLDVLIEEDGRDRRFDVEMQVKKYKNLPKRSRYYHSQIDLDSLLTGNDYMELPDSFVIFLCDFDPFDDDLYKYTFDSICQENGTLLNDGRQTIFLNSHGKNNTDISENLRLLLDFIRSPIENSLPSDSTIVKKLKDTVSSIKYDREWRLKYMQFQEMLREERAEGRAEGFAEGLALGRKEEIEKRLAAEREVERLKKLLAEKE